MELLFRWHSILQASKSSSCGISFADSKVPDQAIIKTNPKQFPLPTGGGGWWIGTSQVRTILLSLDLWPLGDFLLPDPGSEKF